MTKKTEKRSWMSILQKRQRQETKEIINLHYERKITPWKIWWTLIGWKTFSSQSEYLKWVSGNFTFKTFAQLVERLFPTPEICSSNPVVGKFYLLSTVLKWPKIIFIRRTRQNFVKICSKLGTLKSEEKKFFVCAFR